jgi:hypothetical protein
MKPRAPVTFQLGERVHIVGMHKNWVPVIVALDVNSVTVKTEGLPGSEQVLKVSQLEKIK